MSLKRKYDYYDQYCNEDEDDYEYKKIKFNELLFTNDYIRLILSFLDRNFIFRTCSLISKQFREQAINTPVVLYIEKKENLDRIRNLPNPLNITELNTVNKVIDDVLDWIFHHPLKHLKKLRIKRLFWGSMEDEHVERLCSMPALSTLTLLHLEPISMTNKGCSFIANCEYFQNLTEFSLRNSKCNEKGAELIVRSKYMSKLTSLSFRRNNFRTIEGVLSSPLFLQVKKLDLSDCSIKKLIFPQVMPLLEDLDLSLNKFGTNNVVTALTRTRNLTKLNLYDVELDRDGLKHMVENHYLSKLTDLDVDHVAVTSDMLEYIVSSQYFKQLKFLNLESTLIGNDGCIVLAENENMRNLTSLTLGSRYYACFITLNGLCHIFHSRNMSNLQVLSLKGLNLVDKTENFDFSMGKHFGDMLVKSSFGKNLKSVKLIECHLKMVDVQSIAQLDGLTKLNITHYNPIDTVCECIASSSHMSNLTSLTLSCKVKDSGCVALANSIYLTQLATLNLSFNEIGNDGCEYIVNSPNFPNLTSLDMTGNNKMNHIALKMIQHSPHFKNLKRSFVHFLTILNESEEIRLNNG